MRLAPPPWFLNPGRNAFLNEANGDHHARLIAVLHVYMVEFLATVARCYFLPEAEEWTFSWQRVLEICQNIAGIAEKRNSNFTLTVDPAVSCIIFTALIFLDFDKKSAGATDNHLISKIENYELLLVLQLEQFATYWKLPSLLIRPKTDAHSYNSLVP
ncbi:unnamed protein product [Fusarium venenatum]|uniref:Transcription factor domain-containing protein n=1 Tax=Fusarium venenatum TaxID=56646 RepID=A0A2L2SZ60_9HYPO|nr:uncharacterized protein FVRRES_07830 [Fusarium venenatum]CEI63394.1 unnamed protein product [Fusarium venenatum]